MRSEFLVWKEIIAVNALSKLSLRFRKIEANSASSDVEGSRSCAQNQNKQERSQFTRSRRSRGNEVRKQNETKIHLNRPARWLQKKQYLLHLLPIFPHILINFVRGLTVCFVNQESFPYNANHKHFMRKIQKQEIEKL